MPRLPVLAVVAGLLMGGAAQLVAQSEIDALARARAEVAASPRDPVALLELGRLEARLGLTEQALASLSTVSAIDPRLTEPYLVGAVLLRDSGRHDAAMALLRRGLSAGAAEPLLLGLLAQLQLTAGDAAAALETARRGLEASPGDVGMLLVEGLAMALDPDDRTAAIDRLERALARTDKAPATAYLELGRLLTEAGRAADAVPHLRRATEIAPDLPEAFYRLGTALQQAGDPAGAQRALERSQELTQERDKVEHRAKELSTSLNEIETLVEAGELTAARGRLEELLRQNPQEPLAHAMMARVMYELKLPRAGLASAERALELAPLSVEAHYLVGIFLANMGRMEEARSVLTQALALAPGSEPVLQLLRRMDEAEAESGGP